MHVRRTPLRLAGLAICLAIAGAACSGSAGTPPTDPASGSSGASSTSALAGQTITLYNAQHEQATAALVAAFTAQTGIKVEVRSDDESVLTAQIEQEGSQSPADVFYTENSPWLEQLDQKGLLSKVDEATLGQVPAADSGASGDWVGVSARVSALVYNTDKLKPADLPKSILDLADPKWQGKLELAPGETDFWPIVSSVAKAEGDAKTVDWLKALKTNAGANANVPDNETLVSDVNSGTAELGLINHYYFFRMQAETGTSNLHSALAYFAPQDPGYLLDVSGAAVLKSSDHQAAAQAFVAFLTSTGGQTILAQGDSYEYPIANGVAPNRALEPLSSLTPNSFSVADLGTGEDAQTLLDQAQLL